MKSSGCTGPSAGTHEITSVPAAPGKAGTRQRLAEALRANLGRRKAQKKERAKQAGAAAEGEAGESAAVSPPRGHE